MLRQMRLSICFQSGAQWAEMTKLDIFYVNGLLLAELHVHFICPTVPTQKRSDTVTKINRFGQSST